MVKHACGMQLADGGDVAEAGASKAELERLVDEYHGLDAQDYVAGVACRFRYREARRLASGSPGRPFPMQRLPCWALPSMFLCWQRSKCSLRTHAELLMPVHALLGAQVPATSYGLNIAEILALPDRELNQVVGMKRLAPYRDDGGATRPNYGKLRELQVLRPALPAPLQSMHCSLSVPRSKNEARVMQHKCMHQDASHHSTLGRMQGHAHGPYSAASCRQRPASRCGRSGRRRGQRGRHCGCSGRRLRSGELSRQLHPAGMARSQPVRKL